MKRLPRILIALLLPAAVALTGCKPAEKHYRSAYDAARAKREAANADTDGLIPAGGLQSVDGPRLRDVGGKQIYVQTEPVKSEDGALGYCNVAVALYSMDTNADALAAQLKKEGYNTVVATNGDGKHYVIISVTDTIGVAAQIVTDFMRFHKDFTYSGLPGAPVVILR